MLIAPILACALIVLARYMRAGQRGDDGRDSFLYLLLLFWLWPVKMALRLVLRLFWVVDGAVEAVASRVSGAFFAVGEKGSTSLYFAPVQGELRRLTDDSPRTLAGLSLSNTGGTDHLSFDGIGLPGFQFIQDDIEYDTRTHHSNMDVFDRIQGDDMKQAATIMAAFVYQTAMRDDKLPRKPEPGAARTANNR